MEELRRHLYVLCAIFAVFGVRAQLNKSFPPIEQDLFSVSVTERIYETIVLMTENFTSEVAHQFSYCITDIEKERNDAFNFSSNAEFLTICAIETGGDMLQRLCSLAEIKFYFDNYVGTGKANGNKNCNTSSWTPGCESGWSSSTSAPFDPQNSKEMPARTENYEPCCSGFFCPRGLTCMIPCPLGAYCPKAKLNSSTGLCDPYRYQLPPGKDNYTCGGADRWADAGSTSEVFCSAGFYCPTTTEKLDCSDGHYCRLGSTSERRCYQLTSCKPYAANQNIRAYGIMLIVAIITLLLLIYNCSDQVLIIRERRRAKARKAAARSARESMQARERWRLAREAAKRWANKCQRQLSGTFSCIQSSKTLQEQEILAPPQMLLSDDVSFIRLSTVTDMKQESSIVSSPVSVELGDLYEIQSAYIDDQEDPKSAHMLAFTDHNVKKYKAHKHHAGQSRTRFFEYAYGEIEKEKITQANHMILTDAISKASLNGTRPKIEVSFEDLSLTLKGNGKKILRNVTGKLMPGRIAAVMGPSGAGKTTFLNALAGKATGCVVTGSVFINGKPESIYSYKKIIGFVPQDDIVHGNLTVEENIWFNAKCRLPVSMPKAEKVFIVERVIEALGLQSVRDSVVGTVERRGISGGQRKRVNVGLEMVMEPSLLILDEPTSGLDSTSSQLLLKALRREALAGVNISMVLHQPSYGLFKMFDDLMLLAKGGCTVYLGPMDEVEKYFSSLGIIVPERVNPPDHFMDILEGITKPDGNPNFDCNDLPINWMHFNGYDIPTGLQHTSARGTNTNNKPSDNGNKKSFGQDLWEEVWCNLELKWEIIRHSFLRVKDLSNRQTPNFFKQFILFLQRIAKQRFREATIQAQDYLILLLSGISMGILAKVKDENFGVVGYTYTIIAMSLLSMIAALRTFSQDKLHYWRESAAGMNRVAYFIAKDSIDHFNTVIKPLVYLSMFYFFNNPRSTFGANYIVTLVMVYCVQGIAYIFAITLNPGSAQLCSVLFPVICTLLATQQDPDSTVKHLMDATYSRWALEAYMIANAKMYSGVWLISRCGALRKRGYSLKHWVLCISVLVGFGVLARLIAFICLLSFNRKRQR